MYDTILTLHSVFRWLIILAFIWALYRSLNGWLGDKTWSSKDRVSGRVLSSVFDVQLLLGLLLYIFFSPLTRAAFQDMGSAMSNSVLRFFVVEHFLLMLIALVLVHVGVYKSTRLSTAKNQHRVAFIYYVIAFVLTLVAIPWPFLPYGKAWI
ncbi:MAG: hypothetical protein K9G67_08365 [Bacteroidales bacterium]|nr:hypothetical protein [Bacteroidales bacterium]MCF8350019.1 hypothetical protein [Bacteroidales bacterium]MCF8376352.1 hypothetical protein [Bacteroidales bacterium]MCF8400518.1 hypothetical protein [Bacteroidales bacterium]